MLSPMTDLNSLCITCLSTVEDGANISEPILDFLCKDLRFKCQRHSKLVCRQCYRTIIEVRRFWSQLRDVELYVECRSKSLEADVEHDLIEVVEEIEEIEHGTELEEVEDTMVVEEHHTTVDIPEDSNDPILIVSEPVLNVEYHVVEDSELPPPDPPQRLDVIKCSLPTCLTCNKTFRIVSELRSHHRTHHPTKPALIPVSRGQEKERNCRQCGAKFHSLRDLTGHLRNHELDKTKPFRCFKCNRRFQTKEALHDHKLVHRGTEVQTCECEICHKKYLNQSSLEAHKKLVHSW